MAEVYNRLYIEINEEVTDIITAVQNDANSRFLDVTLLDNGQPINLTGEDVKIYMKKPDGTEVFNNGTVTDAVNGRCQFELTSQALGAVGVLETQISIWQGATTILSTQVFNIYVTTSLISEGSVESSNEYGALVLLFQNIYEAYDLMTEMIQKIGVPGPQAQALNLDTMFEVWDYMVNYLKTNSVAGINDNVNSILSAINNTTYGLNAIRNAIPNSIIKKIQRGTANLTSGLNGTATITLSGFTNLSKMIVILNGSNIIYNTNYVGTPNVYVSALTLTTLTVTSADNETAANVKGATVSYQVIEFL